MSMETLADTLFGCWHRRKTLPISPRMGPDRRKRPAPFQTYVVCLDCGKEFPYNWEEMRVLTPAEIRRATANGGEVERRAPVAEPVGGAALEAR